MFWHSFICYYSHLDGYLRHFQAFGWGAIYIIQAVVIYLVLLKIEMLLHENTSSLLSLKQPVAYFPYFMAGSFIARYDILKKVEERRMIPSVYTSSFILVIIAIIFTSIKDYTVLSNLHGLTAIAIIAMLCSLMVLGKNSNTKIDRVLEYIGKNTLDIYIYHYIIILLLHLEPFANWFCSTGNYLIETLFSIVLSVGVAYFSLLIGILVRKSQFLSNIIYGQFVTYENGRVLWKWHSR